jgi:hypothetical protein
MADEHDAVPRARRGITEPRCRSSNESEEGEHHAGQCGATEQLVSTPGAVVHDCDAGYELHSGGERDEHGCQLRQCVSAAPDTQGTAAQ